MRYAIGFLYGLPHFFNALEYKKLSERKDLSAFRVGNDEENEFVKQPYIKFYFRPNYFKILVKRLMLIEPTGKNNNQIYDEVIENLTVNNLLQLGSYLIENKDRQLIQGSIFSELIDRINLAADLRVFKPKINSLSSDSLSYFLSEYDSLNLESRKLLNQMILEKINGDDSIKKSILEIDSFEMYEFLKPLGEKKL